VWRAWRGRDEESYVYVVITATHCNTLQHTATHSVCCSHMCTSSLLQHTTTHCNTQRVLQSYVYVVLCVRRQRCSQRLCCSTLNCRRCGAVWCSVEVCCHCVAVCCQRVAVWCSVANMLKVCIICRQETVLLRSRQVHCVAVRR